MFEAHNFAEGGGGRAEIFYGQALIVENATPLVAYDCNTVSVAIRSEYLLFEDVPENANRARAYSI